MLDYAANAVVYWPVERLRATFELNSQGSDPSVLVSDLVGDEGDPEQFWEQVATNLHAGRVRLVFVADEIPTELQRVVEFLNTQMTPAEVLAIEVKQFVGEGLRTLVPRVLGQTAEAQQRKRESRKWDEESFIRELAAQQSQAEVVVAQRLIAWTRERGLRGVWGHGKQTGSFTPKLDDSERPYGPVVVWTTGEFNVYLEWLKTIPPFDYEPKRAEFVQRLNQIHGIEIDIATSTTPLIELKTLTADDAFQTFVAALDWWFAELKASQNGSG